ncbi:MAG: nitroreductase family protein [Candidatus Babeliales bacterium]
MFTRKSPYTINKLFLDRWSPRAMSGLSVVAKRAKEGQAIADEQLMTLFEAARWAPSSYNNQPWRFVYATKNSPHWQKFFDLMVPFNQSWTQNAAVLVIILSRKKFEFNNEPTRTHSFDTGAAWMSLALQGALMGLVVHGMEGFDYDKAHAVVEASDDYVVEAMCAIGKPGRIQDLPPELQKKEEISDRRPLSEIVFQGVLGSK